MPHSCANVRHRRHCVTIFCSSLTCVPMPSRLHPVNAARVVAALACLVASVPTAPAVASAGTPIMAPIFRAGDPARTLHLRLEKSEPARGAVLATPPTAIRLWYSLPPELSVTAVKLASADGTAITLSKPTRGSGAKDPVSVNITHPLAPGGYVVSWKTSSKDGHPISGDFSFTVKAGG